MRDISIRVYSASVKMAMHTGFGKSPQATSNKEESNFSVLFSSSVWPGARHRKEIFCFMTAYKHVINNLSWKFLGAWKKTLCLPSEQEDQGYAAELRKTQSIYLTPWHLKLPQIYDKTMSSLLSYLLLKFFTLRVYVDVTDQGWYQATSFD